MASGVINDAFMTVRSYKTKLLRDSGMCAIPVPFDAKEVFGKTRAPVRVTINGYTYRSTIAAMGGPLCIPLRKSHREAAGIEGGETSTSDSSSTTRRAKSIRRPI